MTKIKKIVKKPIINFIVGLPDNKVVIVDAVHKNGNINYLWAGNTQLHHALEGNYFEKDYMTIIWHNDPKRSINVGQVVVNCISDADLCSKSLQRAVDITQGIKEQFPQTHIYNDPKQVLKTTRDAIYEQFHHLEHIIIPKVIRVSPSSAQDVLDLAKKHHINFPFLVRQCGSHQSEGLCYIASKKDVNQLHQHAFDGRAFYITQFIDNKHEDGLYKKARLVIIEGELYARHYMSHPNWLVEGAVHFNYMPDHEETKVIEKNFLEHFKEILGPKVITDLMTIYHELGLNFLAFDVDMMPDGKLLIFEINLAQNIFLDIDMQHFDYMKESGDKIKAALHKSVLGKIKI